MTTETTADRARATSRPAPFLRLLRAGALGAVVACAAACGCGGGGEGDRGPCAEPSRCDSGKPAGPVHGVRADGTVDVTAAQAWPGRLPEPPPLSAEEIARACALLGACLTVEEMGGHAGDDENVLRPFWMSICALPNGAEERAIPVGGANERWIFQARDVLANKGDCAAVRAVLTKRPEGVYCEEAGCWWTSKTLPIPSVACQGDVATLATGGRTFVRDCSRAYQKCDPTSPTGCTDRRPVACDPAGKDRCDGDVRLGCDGTGRVSFHDCARVPGGKCGAADGKLQCVYPSGDCAIQQSCNAAKLTTCVLGQKIETDCAALGLSVCKSGHCAT